MKRNAVLSAHGVYRYLLTREWSSGPQGAIIMLNPSTADEFQDDPTIRKCIGFAQRLGWGGFSVVNLYAYRATDPADLRRAGYPIGPHNEQYIERAVDLAADTGAPVVAAWGRKGHQQQARVRAVLAALRSTPVFALRIAKTGAPSHPLMLPYSTQLLPYYEQNTNSSTALAGFGRTASERGRSRGGALVGP